MKIQTTSRFNVGDSLRRAQKERKVTNKSLSEKFGVSLVQVGRWRNSTDMRIGHIEAIADYLEMDVHEFLELGK
jgi:transcriptional regulator with XRE-family HTH domain